jgi:hypothetical protein
MADPEATDDPKIERDLAADRRVSQKGRRAAWAPGADRRCMKRNSGLRGCPVTSQKLRALRAPLRRAHG